MNPRKKSANELFKNFTETYSGRALLNKYDRNTEGVWMIRGEDSNCDFGGPHYEPILAYVKGKLQDVIMYAVVLKDFWQWGAGGSIHKIEIFDVEEELSKKHELRMKKIQLEAEIAKIKEELGEEK